MIGKAEADVTQEPRGYSLKCIHFYLAKIAVQIKNVQKHVKAKNIKDRYQQEMGEWKKKEVN